MSDGPVTWQSTKLWKILSERIDAAGAISTTLGASLPKIELLLTKASTAPVNFTLHDDEHGFRVAETMADLVPSDVMGRLSSFEIAHLLLSAYLHDIGMNPRQEVVTRHYQYLVTAAPNLLRAEEQLALQEWLDLERDAVEAPICSSIPTPAELDLAQEMAAYYCRHRHNDWSEDWIRTNLASIEPGLYHAWLDDQIALCRSHHLGLSALRERRFDSRIRSPSWSIHQICTTLLEN